VPREQRFSFDEVAELYDRVRPSYPAALVEDVLTWSGVTPGERILEIGCGTGLATQLFASRGYRMLCLEPGPEMARVGRARLARFPAVELVQSTLEDWQAEPAAFGLAISAQAFHWVDAAIGLPRLAEALRPGGALAIFGSAPVADASPLREALDRAYAAHAPTLGPLPSTRWYAGGVVAEQLARSARFGPVELRAYPWSQVYGAEEYADLLSTSSDHRMLPTEQREALLAAIRAAVEEHGGCIEVRYETHLHLARRA
jgi:SAM-dependent methyltransferase